MLDKKQIWAIFLSSKWVIKQWRQLATLTTHLDQELLMNEQCSGGLRSFAKETRALKTRRVVASHWKLTTTIWEQSSKLILLQLHEKKITQHWPFYVGSRGIWSKLGRWKVLISGCLMSWLQIKKIITLKCHLLLFYETMNHFLIELWCVMKSGFYMKASNDQLSGWTEKKLQSTSQSQTCTKKRSQSLLGGLLPVWSTTAFWIPAKPLHLRSVLSKSVRSPTTAIPATSTGQQNKANFSPQLLVECWTATNTSTVEQTVLQLLPHLPYSADLSPTHYHFFKHLDNF